MTEMNRPAGLVSVGQAIAALREELLEAWSSAPDSRLRFRPSPVELTIEAVVTSDASAKAGVKWWLLEAGGELTRGVSATHTVKLTLDPVFTNAQGEPVEFLVSDVADETMSSPGRATVELSDRED
jgi:Trypsin-co-occurring domain 2